MRGHGLVYNGNRRRSGCGVFQGIGDSIRDGLMAGAALTAKETFHRE